MFTGSTDWTNDALHDNDESMLRIWDPSVFVVFSRQCDKVRASAKDSMGIATSLTDAGVWNRTSGSTVTASVEDIVPVGD